MSNERIRSAIAATGASMNEIAERTGVDAKTLERWINEKGRKPHRANKLRFAAVVQREEAYLWPDDDDPARNSASSDELLRMYQNRGSVPHELWLSLFEGARECIDILAYAATFLHDSLPDLAETLANRLDAGVQVRLLLGDPDSAAVAARGQEERIGEGLRGRCELTWTYFNELHGHPGLLARRHGTTLYASLFRFDEDLLANHHLYGAPASQSPVAHFQRVPGGRLFLNHMHSFERVWDQAALGSSSIGA